MKTAPKLTSQRRATFVGRYWSEELQTTYDVMVKEGKLYLSHLRNGQFELSQAWNDDFVNQKWYLNSVQFLSFPLEERFSSVPISSLAVLVSVLLLLATFLCSGCARFDQRIYVGRGHFAILTMCSTSFRDCR